MIGRVFFIVNIEKTELIRLLWQNDFFENNDLEFFPNNTFEVINKGIHIEGAVSDFSGVILRDKTSEKTLKGGIKISINSSDWRTEGTIGEPQYDNIVLHLVANHDTQLFNSSEPIISCQLTPKAWITEFIEKFALQCPKHFASMSSMERTEILSQLLDERVKRKTDEVLAILDSARGDWYECSYICFLRAMGASGGNKDEFEKVARSVDYAFVSLHSRRQTLVEAMLLGQTGYLDLDDCEQCDEYTTKLRTEFLAARSRDGILPTVVKWNRIKVRPSSAPALSLVRAAAIMCRNPELFDQIIAIENLDELFELFTVELEPYWQSHCAPMVGSGGRYGSFGGKRMEALILNFVIPILYARSITSNDEQYATRAYRFYEELSAEHYSLHDKWCSAQWHPNNAFDSQALVQLNDTYCKTWSCASCPILKLELRHKWQQTNNLNNL